MTKSDNPATTCDDSRRLFLKGSAAAGAALAAHAVVGNAHAAGNDVLKVGLVGCGGRGSGAAKDALEADPNTKLVAMGDAFKDRLDSKYKSLQGQLGDRFDVPAERCFVGFDAYKHVIDASDVVILATPPHFRPLQIRAAVEAGKHVFAEKPVAVDGPGVRSVLETCKLAKKKNLAVVSGLCWRYHEHMREVVGRVLDGQIGDIVSMQTNYNTRRPRQGLPRAKHYSDMEYQLRNWYFYTWLSGDHNVEQHVHSLDKMAWVMGDKYPVKCFGVGGRAAIASDEPGNIFDHHAVSYEFENGVVCNSYCRQISGAKGDVSDHIFGTKGYANLMGFQIKGDNPWKKKATSRRNKKQVNMYVQEHRELFAGIREGKPINNGEYMTFSSLMAIMGRMATYTGQEVTWDQALNSSEDLSPSAYDWTNVPEPSIAVPGLTQLA